MSENHDDLCHWLCTCVNELQKENGEPYTTSSLAMFIAVLRHYISEEKDAPVRLCNPDSPFYIGRSKNTIMNCMLR